MNTLNLPPYPLKSYAHTLEFPLDTNGTQTYQDSITAACTATLLSEASDVIALSFDLEWNIGSSVQTPPPSENGTYLNPTGSNFLFNNQYNLGYFNLLNSLEISPIANLSTDDVSTPFSVTGYESMAISKYSPQTVNQVFQIAGGQSKMDGSSKTNTEGQVSEYHVSVSAEDFSIGMSKSSSSSSSTTASMDISDSTKKSYKIEDWAVIAASQPLEQQSLKWTFYQNYPYQWTSNLLGDHNPSQTAMPISVATSNDMISPVPAISLYGNLWGMKATYYVKKQLIIDNDYKFGLSISTTLLPCCIYATYDGKDFQPNIETLSTTRYILWDSFKELFES